jgi:hypothetical protein
MNTTEHPAAPAMATVMPELNQRLDERMASGAENTDACHSASASSNTERKVLSLSNRFFLLMKAGLELGKATFSAAAILPGAVWFVVTVPIATVFGAVLGLIASSQARGPAAGFGPMFGMMMGLDVSLRPVAIAEESAREHLDAAINHCRRAFS